MTLIEWITSYDPALKRLFSKYVLNEIIEVEESPMITSYLSHYHKDSHLLGEGFYSPKWTSSHYILSNRFRKLPLQRIKLEMNETNFFL